MRAPKLGYPSKGLGFALGGTVEAGEMSVREEERGLLLPTAIFARWSKS